MVKKKEETVEEITPSEKDFDNLIQKALSEEPEEVTTQKKRKGRKKVSTPLPPPIMIDKSLLKPFINFPFDYLAKRAGAHWTLVKEEEETLIELSTKVVSKRLPTWLEKFADEIALALYALIIVLPRIEQTKKLKESKTESKTETSNEK